MDNDVCAAVESTVDSVVRPRHGIEVRPVFLGDFDRYTDRGWHQVRVNLWGWPAAVVEWIMRRNWIKRHMEPDTPNSELGR